MNVRYLFLGFVAFVNLYVAAASAGENFPPANGYQVLGKEHLATDQGWMLSDTRFTPATASRHASVEFTPDHWSALISTLPLDRLTGTFSFHLRAHWAVLASGGQAVNVAVMYLDSEGAELPGTKNKFLAGKGDAQDCTVENPIPKGAATVRLDVISSAGGTLEIEAYDLFYQGLDLSTAAVAGMHMPWLKVTGGKDARPDPGPDGASAAFVSANPAACDDPAWRTLPEYPISTTTNNKTPLNDVAASFQLAWNADALYVHFHAHDRTLNFNDATPYLRDCFEFFLLPSGRAENAAPGGSKEQYNVTRTKDGKTEANADATTRLVSGGWEAVVKIPLRTDARRIFPFNGLGLTFNAAYQDANTFGQEHWLSFSKKDQTNVSFNTSAVYVPLVFATDQTLPYQPMELGNTTAYHVEPKFPGRINLVHSAGSLDNIVPWIEVHDARIEASKADGHDTFRIQYPDYSPQPRVAFSMSPFNVLAGETLNLEMEGRVGSGAAVKAPALIFLAQANWQQIPSEVAPATMGTEWTKLTYTLKVPDRFHDNLRNERPLFSLESAPGRTLEIRDVRVTRRLPADFDALISVESYYSHFWSGEKNAIHFRLAAGTPAKTKIQAAVQDYFSGKTLLTQEWTRDVPAGETGLDWDVSALPNGFFDVLLKVRDDKGNFLADRELYVSKGVKASKASAFSGLWLGNNYGLAAPQNIPATVSTLHDLGIGMVQFGDFTMYDSRGQEVAWDASKELKAFHAAGFETGFTVPQAGSHNINRLWQPDELEDFYEQFCTRTRGLFSHLSFSNEPNLTMGWFPVPDAREWAIYNRGWYNAVKKYAPGTTPICGSFNGVPVKYMQEAAAENRHSFADGVIGLHAYGADGGQYPFKTLLEQRQQIEQLHPGWDVWDTESGLVDHTFRSFLESHSRKAALLRVCGITRSYLYNDVDLIVPCSDSNPLIAMEGFTNTFYLDATPVGHLAQAGGKLEIYLFKDASGQGRAVYWNRGQEDATLDLPTRASSELFDVFGNSAGTFAEGTQHLIVKDRFVHYVRGADLVALTKDASFVPAFQHLQTPPATDPGCTTAVYFSLPYIIRAFDRELPVGQPSSFAVSLHNAGPTPQRVALNSQGPRGLQIEYEKGSSIFLRPGETQIVPVKLLAKEELPQQSFTLAGTLADGASLLPLIFTARTTPAIDVNGYTRAVELRNNAGAPADVSVTPAKPEFFFTPAAIKERLEPSTTKSVALQIAHKETNENTFNTPVYYDLIVKSAQGAYTKPGISTVFSAEAEPEAAADFAHLPYTAVPRQPGQDQFQVEYKLGWVHGDLRITARVQDASPVQTQEGGQLKSGGDCMLVAFDVDRAQTPGTFGAGYLECGFAVSNGAPTSYVWDGRNGLESSTPFTEAVRRISRDAKYIYYDVRIPGSRIFPDKNAASAGMSIAFVNRTADGKSELIELGQGILPERQTARLGLLLKPM